MLSRSVGLAAAIALTLSFPAFAQSLTMTDGYARSASPSAKSGAAFLMISNSGETDDTLVAVESDVAARIELHTHIDDGNGVMRMTEIEGGIPVPAGGMAEMKRGGMHVMFMGLTRPLLQDETVDAVLIFESGAEVPVTIPVDLERKPGHGPKGHGHKHGS